jgi:hypothetical protein
MYFPSLLLALDPHDNLMSIKNELPAGSRPEVGHPNWNKSLPYGPRRAANQLCHLTQIYWRAKRIVRRKFLQSPKSIMLTEGNAAVGDLQLRESPKQRIRRLIRPHGVSGEF